MAVKLTTGPFLVPQAAEIPFRNTGLSVILKNPTKKEQSVTVYFELCQNTIYPVTSPEITEPPHVVTLPPHSCTSIHRPLTTQESNGSTIFRVTIVGDIEEEGGKIEVELIGGQFILPTNLLTASPALIFRHNDFIRTEHEPEVVINE